MRDQSMPWRRRVSDANHNRGGVLDIHASGTNERRAELVDVIRAHPYRAAFLRDDTVERVEEAGKCHSARVCVGRLRGGIDVLDQQQTPC